MIIDNLGPLAVAARLQRLADTIRRDGVIVYKDHGIDFEPKWFPIVYVLHEKGPTSVVDLAAEVGIAHPSVIQLVKELEAKKLVKSTADKKDGRKRLLSLTPTAVKLVTKMKPVWKKIRKAVEEMTETENNLMKAMMETEERLKQESFYQRVMRQKTNKN
jgi:DNA-binding MarR family transcriptional regulator